MIMSKHESIVVYGTQLCSESQEIKIV